MQALEVFLNGPRTYVQGTQMIARALELAAATSPGPHVLTAATFQRITDRLVSVAAPGTGAPGQVLGTLQLETGAGRTSYELIEGDTTAPRADIGVLPAWTEIAEARQSPLTASFALEGLTCGEDYLVAVVQIVKGLHEALGADVHDVWLTGFRSANIPFTPFPATAGRLDVSFRRGMRGEEGWQTLMMTSFESPELAAPIRAAVTFVFKSESIDHVH